MNHAQHGHANHGHGCCGGNHTLAHEATDPVCGMTVDPKFAAGVHEHAGVKYYFCSKHCLSAFKADPAKYSAKAAPAAAPVAPKGSATPK